MTVLDAYCLIAYLREEPAAPEVEGLLQAPTTLSTANQVEVLDQLIRVSGYLADDVEADIATLSVAGMAIAAVDERCAVAAGRLRARHYHAKKCAVSLADCIAAATASLAGVPLATADPALAALIRATGGELIPLPDLRGRRP